MPQVIELDGQYLTEDGNGGWRKMYPEEAAQLHVPLPEPLASTVVDSFTNEMGTTIGQRFALKNFARDNESAKKYLRALGYEVRQYQNPSLTDPMPLWVRKGPSDAWRPVDPHGFGIGETILDLLDLTTDAVQGALTTSAAAAGAAAGPLGAGAAGGTVFALADYAKDAAGQLLGIPQEPSAIKSAVSGAMAAPLAAIPTPKAMPAMPTKGMIPQVPFGSSPAGKFALQMSAKIAGTTPELLTERAKITGFGLLPAHDVTIQKIQDVMRRMALPGARTPARLEADEIVKEAEKRGTGVNMEAMIDRIRQFTLEPVETASKSTKVSLVTTEKEFKQAVNRAAKSNKSGVVTKEGTIETWTPTGSGRMRGKKHAFGREANATEEAASDATQNTSGKSVSEILTKTTREGTTVKMTPRTAEAATKRISEPNIPSLASKILRNVMDRLEFGNIDPASVPPSVAESLKRELQQIATMRGSYKNIPMTKNSQRVVSTFATAARKDIETALDATGIVGPKMAKNYSATMRELDKTMSAIERTRRGFFKGTDDVSRIKSAEGTMKMLYGSAAGHEYLAALRTLDRKLGTDMVEQARTPIIKGSLAEEAKRASMGLQFSDVFGKGGSPNWAPRFTAQGRFLGPGMLPLPGPGAYAGIAGKLAFGWPGAIGAVGFASPRTQLGLVKAAMTISAHNPTPVIAARLATSPLTKSALVAGLAASDTE